MMMRFVLASMVAVMMGGVVCAEEPGDLLLQRKKVSGSGFDKLFVTPEEGKALGWSGGTLGMVDFLAADGDGSALTGITAGQVGALADGDTLVQFLKFPNGGLRLLDVSGDHALQVGFNEELTANRALNFVMNDAGRTVNLAGNLTVSAAATVSGTNTGDQTSVTGNAGTATRLATARTINGVSFDGTENITVPAGATSIWVGAAEFVPRTTNGPGVASYETATNLVNYDTLEFDPNTAEFAQVLRTLPNNWTAGTITVTFYWSGGSSSGAVVWRAAARALADDDAIDTARGTAQTVTDTLLAVGDMHISSATSAITVAGSPTSGTPIVLEVSRDAANGSDTFGADARLIGVRVIYNP